MHQDIALRAHLDDRFRRRRVAREDDGAPAAIEAVAVCLGPTGVGYGEGGHADALVLVDHAGLDLDRLHPPSVGRRGLVAAEPVFDVRHPRRRQVLGHGDRAAGTEEAERHLALEHPGRVDEVGQSKGVIAVQVREEGDVEARRRESLRAVPFRRRRRAPHDARARVHEVGVPVHEHRRGGTRGLGLRVRGARPQQHDVRPRGKIHRGVIRRGIRRVGRRGRRRARHERHRLPAEEEAGDGRGASGTSVRAGHGLRSFTRPSRSMARRRRRGREA